MLTLRHAKTNYVVLGVGVAVKDFRESVMWMTKHTKLVQIQIAQGIVQYGGVGPLLGLAVSLE